MKRTHLSRLKRKCHAFTKDVSFIWRRLPSILRYVVNGPAVRIDHSMTIVFISNGNKYNNPRGKRLDTVQEKKLKQAISVFCWRSCQVLKGLGYTENDAICQIQEIVGEDRCESFLTNGRKLTPRWSNFSRTADANKADRSIRPITSQLFPSVINDTLVRDFHLGAIEAISLGLDQATKNGILMRTWINQFNNGHSVPDYSATPASRTQILPKDQNQFLWIAMFSGINPTILWNEINWPDEIIDAYDTAIILGRLICQGKSIVSPQDALAVRLTYYQEETDEVDENDIAFVFNPIRRLIDHLIDVDKFNESVMRDKDFTVFAPGYTPKPIMVKIKEKACELSELAQPQHRKKAA